MPTYNGRYAANGSMNISVVSGAAYTGLYAADGSINVVQNDGTALKPATHPCGALNVFKYVSGISPIRHASGNLVVNPAVSVSNNTGQPVTVVAGVLA